VLYQHAVNELKGSNDPGGFGEGIHEGIVLLMEVDNFENILVLAAKCEAA
jgi:hypothetical protein